MGKTRNRIRILLCCLLISCLALSGCRLRYRYNRAQHFRYSVYNINGGDPSKCEDYFYYSYGIGIAQFSIADQDITNCMISDGNIDAYAVCDEYIIFLATPRGSRTDPDELWKYDRTTESFELLLEVEPDRIGMVEVCEDFIIYGDSWGRDVYVCPIDGNPETDSINLLSLLEEDNRQDHLVQKGLYHVREISYQGLRVLFFRESGSEEYYVLGIVEEESGEVIWDIVFLSNNTDLVFWGEGEWIIFTIVPGSNFFYQREGEEERHRIQCLDDSKYRYTGIWPFCLTMEGERLVGLMSVSLDPRGLLTDYQDEIQNDVLFEINLKTDTSRIIYETDSAQTRIIGYKNGQVYFLEDDVIYRGWVDKPEREKIYDLKEEGWLLHDIDGRHIDMDFRWQGDYLIIETAADIRSICVSD